MKHTKDTGRKLLGYLIGTGAVLGATQAEASIVHFDPADLVAIDVNPDERGLPPGGTTGFGSGRPGGEQQINLGIGYSSDKDTDVATFSFYSTSVTPASDDIFSLTIALRAADLEYVGGSKSGGYSVAQAPLVRYNRSRIHVFPALVDQFIAPPLSDCDPSSSCGSESALTLGTGLFLGLGIETQGSYYSAHRFNYGWLRYSASNTEVVLHDVAIEQDQDAGIIVGATASPPPPPEPGVPEPGTLALLVAGASGLVALRRRRHREVAGRA